MAFKVLIKNQNLLRSYRLGRMPDKVYEDFQDAIKELSNEDELLIMPGVYNTTFNNGRGYNTGVGIGHDGLPIENITIKGYIPRSSKERKLTDSPDVIIEGSIPELTRREAWEKTTEVANSAFSHEQVYVSKSSYPLFGSLELVGYIELNSRQYLITDYGKALSIEQNGQILLSKEESLLRKKKCLVSNKDFLWDDAGNYQNAYLGPGFYHDPETKKIYVRLEALSADVVGAERTFPMSFEDFFNPELGGKLLFSISKNNAIQFSAGSNLKTIKIKNLKFRNQPNVFSFPKADNIEVDQCEFIAQKAINVGNGSQDVVIKNCLFDGAVPPWVSWGDVKNPVKDASGELKLSDISHSPHNVEILLFSPGSGSGNNDINDTGLHNKVINCRFRNCFDAIHIDDHSDSSPAKAAKNILVDNNDFEGIIDDTILVGSRCYNIEISNNRFHRVGTGLALVDTKVGTPLDPKNVGKVFIHHNLIICGPVYGVRSFTNNPLFDAHGPKTRGIWVFFGGHGGTFRFAPRKIYNNTVIVEGALEELHTFGDPSKEQYCIISPQYRGVRDESVNMDRYRHEVYNNILIQSVDLPIISGKPTPGISPPQITDRQDTCQVFNGNIYYRKPAGGPYGKMFWVKITDPEELKSFSSLDELKTEVDWESSGFEGNPNIKADYRPIPKGNAATKFFPISDKTYLPEYSRHSAYCGAFPPKLSSGRIPSRITKFMRSAVRN